MAALSPPTVHFTSARTRANVWTSVWENVAKLKGANALPVDLPNPSYEEVRARHRRLFALVTNDFTSPPDRANVRSLDQQAEARHLVRVEATAHDWTEKPAARIPAYCGRRAPHVRHLGAGVLGGLRLAALPIIEHGSWSCGTPSVGVWRLARGAHHP